jgi:hypothetical protein
MVKQTVTLETVFPNTTEADWEHFARRAPEAAAAMKADGAELIQVAWRFSRERSDAEKAAAMQRWREGHSKAASRIASAIDQKTRRE